MPSKPKRRCTMPGCTNYMPCPEHSCKKLDNKRGTASYRGYDARWRRARLMFLNRNPTCVMCNGIGTVVDHIVPHRGDKDKFWDYDNWQTLCKQCHDKKTAKGE